MVFEFHRPVFQLFLQFRCSRHSQSSLFSRAAAAPCHEFRSQLVNIVDISHARLQRSHYLKDGLNIVRAGQSEHLPNGLTGITKLAQFDSHAMEPLVIRVVFPFLMGLNQNFEPPAKHFFERGAEVAGCPIFGDASKLAFDLVDLLTNTSFGMPAEIFIESSIFFRLMAREVSNKCPDIAGGFQTFQLLSIDVVVANRTQLIRKLVQSAGSALAWYTRRQQGDINRRRQTPAGRSHFVYCIGGWMAPKVGPLP